MVIGDRFNCTEMFDFLLCQEFVVIQDRWSFMAVVLQDSFQCTEFTVTACTVVNGKTVQYIHFVHMQYYNVATGNCIVRNNLLLVITMYIITVA